MDSDSLFETDTQKKSKNFEMIERFQELEAQLARLQNELDSYAKSWVELGKAAADCSDYNSIRVDDEKVRIQRSTGWHVEAPSHHFDLASIKKLAHDMGKDKGELARIKQQLTALGLGARF